MPHFAPSIPSLLAVSPIRHKSKHCFIYSTPKTTRTVLRAFPSISIFSIINSSITVFVALAKTQPANRIMCSSKSSSSSRSTSLILPITKSSSFLNTHNYKSAMNDYLDHDALTNNVDNDDLHRWPTPSEALDEMKAIWKISGPTAITGLLLYSRSMISMLFLGHLGGLELAGGSLSIGFANITGYSILSGLAMGMEPICGQAYGAKQMKLLGLTLQRTILLLLSTCIPITLLWLNMKNILLYCGQDEKISSVAHTFILFSIPDLFFLSILHPLRIYLRTQNITVPLTYCTAISVILHVPLNFILVSHFNLGVPGIAISMVITNLNLCLFLSIFIYFSKVYKDSWITPCTDCLKGWSSLLSLAIPTCVSVCLEWWWYEFMILLCGLLLNPKATISSMGILIQTTSLIYVFPSSLSLGVSTRVGNELGANRPGKARISMIVSLSCAVVLGLGALLFTTVMREEWGRLFTKDEEILRLTGMVLPIVGLCELGNCPQTTGCGVLRGSARPRVGAGINLGSFYLVGMPVAVVLGFVVKAGFVGLWFGLLAAQGCCALIMVFVLWRTDWELQVEKAKQLTESDGNDSQSTLPVSLMSSNDNVKGDKKKTKDVMVNDLNEVLCMKKEDYLVEDKSISVEIDPLIKSFA